MPSRSFASPVTPALLLRAYAAGVFPMAESADDPELFWVEPRQRGVLPLDGFHLPKRLARTVRRDVFQVTLDADFDAVIAGCAAERPGRRSTWINATIRDLYGALHRRGHAHSIEAWRDGRLVGGLYGVRIGAAFFGESMFSLERDASKVALAHLVARLRRGGFRLLDIQFLTEHLAQFGGVEIGREVYLRVLADAVADRASMDCFPGHGRGEEPLPGRAALASPLPHGGEGGIRRQPEAG